MSDSEKEKTDLLIVKGKVKEYIKSQGCNTSGGLYEALSESVKIIVLDKAIERAKANGRKTIQEKDL